MERSAPDNRPARLGTPADRPDLSRIDTDQPRSAPLLADLPSGDRPASDPSGISAGDPTNRLSIAHTGDGAAGNRSAETDPSIHRRSDTPMTGEGRLIFQISTAGGAIPLEGAEIIVRTFRSLTDGSGGEVISVLYSDSNGKTEVLSLPAPAKDLSLTPGRNGAPAPYALYDAEVNLDSFYSQSYTRIPVFDGITSIQHAALIPLPENGIPDGTRLDGEQFFEGENPNL